MTRANPSLTPTGRLENLSDRVTNLRDRLDGLRDREHLSEWLRDDLDAVRTLLCLLYTSPSPRDGLLSRMPSSA